MSELESKKRPVESEEKLEAKKQKVDCGNIEKTGAVKAKADLTKNYVNGKQESDAKEDKKKIEKDKEKESGKEDEKDKKGNNVNKQDEGKGEEDDKEEDGKEHIKENKKNGTKQEKEQGKQGSKEETKQEKREQSKEEKPKEKPFVFGQNSKFGATAFSLKSKPSVFGSGGLFSKNTSATSNSTGNTSTITGSTPSTPKSQTSSKGFVFGSNSKYANAFQNTLKKTSIFDTNKSKESKILSPALREESKTDSPYQTVKLTKQQIKSGEEEETVLFDCKAKLYMLDLKDIQSGWKERGIGMLRVNELPKKSGAETQESSHAAKARIVMRTLTVMKVILNVSLGKGFEIFKGMESSLQTEKFVRFNTVLEENGEKKLVQYAVKVGNSSTATELYDVIRKYTV